MNLGNFLAKVASGKKKQVNKINNTYLIFIPTPHRSGEDTPEEMVILELVEDALLEEEPGVGLSVGDGDGDLHLRRHVVSVDGQPPVVRSEKKSKSGQLLTCLLESGICLQFECREQ